MAWEVITEPGELAGLEAAWRDLWQRAPNATPFQSPMWLLPWWRAFGVGELHAIALRENGRLDALAPLLILRDDDESLGMIAGSGNSDYVDVLADAEQTVEILAKASDLDCQLWDLQQLRPASPILGARLQEGWTDSITDHDVCPILPLEGATLESLLTTHARKKLRYYRRSLERLGTVAVEVPTTETLDAFLTALFELHAARWRRKGLPGMLADEVDQKFHREAALAMLKAGALRMYATRLEERIVAVFYGFADRDTVYYYLSGYDPDLEKLSIGTIIVAHAIEQAIRDQASTFDFLRGAEQYKYAWGATDRTNKRRQIFKG